MLKSTLAFQGIRGYVVGVESPGARLIAQGTRGMFGWVTIPLVGGQLSVDCWCQSRAALICHAIYVCLR